MPTRNKNEERRSLNRPHFEKSWRKLVAPRGASCHQSPANIDIWFAPSAALLRADSCLQLLTNDDWITVDALKHAPARQSAIASRILLRIGLSQAVKRAVEPGRWAFSAADGRPRIVSPPAKVHYSVSHTDDMAAVAISTDINIGIDVENVDQDIEPRLVESFLSDVEESRLQKLRDSQMSREFVRLWTKKESYSKLLGLGHTLPFKDILLSHSSSHSNSPVRFETFFESHGHSLSHIALAVEETAPLHAAPYEVQMIVLTQQDE